MHTYPYPGTVVPGGVPVTKKMSEIHTLLWRATLVALNHQERRLLAPQGTNLLQLMLW